MTTRAENAIRAKAELEGRKDTRERLARAYVRLNSEEWGKVILEDLRNYCGQDRSSACLTFGTNEVFFSEGKRRVWLHVSELIQEGQNGMD